MQVVSSFCLPVCTLMYRTKDSPPETSEEKTQKSEEKRGGSDAKGTLKDYVYIDGHVMIM